MTNKATNEIITEIRANPVRFFKRYLAYNYSLGQLVFVHLFKKWQEEEEIWVINDLNKQFGTDYKSISEVGTIVRVLQKYYAELEMGDDNMLETAYKLRVIYMARIEKYRKKKVQENLKDPNYKWVAPSYDAKQAFKELVMRGFIPEIIAKIPKTTFYIKGNVGNIVYPQHLKNMEEAQSVSHQVGLPGFTGINQPNYK